MFSRLPNLFALATSVCLLKTRLCELKIQKQGVAFVFTHYMGKLDHSFAMGMGSC